MNGGGVSIFLRHDHRFGSVSEVLKNWWWSLTKRLSRTDGRDWEGTQPLRGDQKSCGTWVRVEVEGSEKLQKLLYKIQKQKNRQRGDRTSRTPVPVTE